MNPLIKEQLAKLNISVGTVDGKIYKVADIPENSVKILFTNVKDNAIINNKLYHFVFDKRLVKPYKGVIKYPEYTSTIKIPLTYMYGSIIKEQKDSYYVKCYGSEISSEYCHHCLKYISKGILCDDCKQLYGIIRSEDIQKVTWEGWVAKQSITLLEEV